MLNRLALRLCTVRALRGRTIAGRNVRDSEMAAIDEVAAAHPTPVIIVYTDDGRFATQGRDLWATAGDKRVDVGYQTLIIECVLTQRMQMTDDDGVPIEGAVPPVLDAALAFNLDIMERQIYAALMAHGDGALWSEMWRKFAFEIGDRASQLGSSMREGVRFAGRQIRLSVKLPRDPAPGDTLGPLWTEFLVLMETDPDCAPLRPMILAALSGEPLPEWLEIARRYGLSRGEARAMQFAPPAIAETAVPLPPIGVSMLPARPVPSPSESD